MMFNKNTKAIVGSSHVDTDVFDIIARVLQEDTLASYIFIIFLDNILRKLVHLIKENAWL